MTDHPASGWEPDPSKMGNWTSLFEPTRAGQPAPRPSPPPAYDDAAVDDNMAASSTEYRPWTVQRGRSRPAMMLELRRYDERSGQWQGWAMSYPSLCAVDSLGDRLLSLDFGTRKFVVEGRGLDELARQLQAGSVITITEFAPSLWPGASGPSVSAIRRIGEKPSAA
jgi:hypothetical protein